VKIRLQTAHELLSSGKIHENYRSIRHCIASISKIEGIRSLWKGNGIGIARFFPNETINLKTRQFLQKRLPNKFETNVLSAMLSGWTASSILYPFDILRLSLSNSTEKEIRIWTVMKNILRNHGARYFFKGYLNSLLGTAIFRGSFHGIYDTVKSEATSLERRAAIAYLCAIVAGGICYPLDIIRRRRIMVNGNHSLLQFSKGIFRKEGIRGFYKGAKLILPQSLTGAIILLLFDTNGIPIFSAQADC
jgi:solute carrier family 25 (adenine nucleotide translocator) protein 4/5/6/31